MSLEEKSDIQELIKSVQRLELLQNEVSKQIAAIDRGLYGDEKNNVKGLMYQQSQDDIKFDAMDLKFEAMSARIGKIENKQYKQYVWLGVGTTIITFIVNLIKSTIWKS